MSNTVVNISLNNNLQTTGNGGVKEWEDVEFYATFENDNAQPNLTVNNEVTIVNQFAELVQKWIDDGYITEGMPIKFEALNSQNAFTAFNGVLDFSDTRFQRIDPTTFKASMKPDEGLNRLDDRANGLTFQYLYDIGIIQNSDFISVPYVVEKEFNFVEMAMLTLGIYLMVEKLADLIRETSEEIVHNTMHTSGGASGAAAVIIGIPLLLALKIAYAVAIIIYLTNMIAEWTSYLMSPVKFHKAIRLNVLMEKAALYLNYGYNTSLGLDAIVYMPSKREIIQDNQFDQLVDNLTVNQPGIGIPSDNDYGYTFSEMLNLVNQVYAAKVAVKNGVIEQHALISGWWYQQSPYTLAPVLTEQRKYNLNELDGTRVISFKTDISDYWTIENFDGTIVEIRTDQANVANTRKNVLIKGLNKVDLPVSLGTRKDKLNRFEEKIKIMARFTDSLINFVNNLDPFNQKPPSNFEAKVVARVGMLKLGKDWFNVPKLMKMNSANKLNANYRSAWSAEYLWNTYHKYYSWDGNNPNQWLIYEDVEIPFGFEDFLNVINNSYFYDNDGNQCKIDSLVWKPNRDKAKVTWRVKTIYQPNINETIIT